MEISDDEIILMIRKKSVEAENMLFSRYKRHILYLANKILRQSHYCGIEVDDLISIGICSIILALENYDPKKSLFYSFWVLICEREMRRLVGKNCNYSQNYLNDALSFDYGYGEDEFTILDCVEDSRERIVNNLIFEEEIDNYQNELSKLYKPNDVKIKMLQMYGFAYKDIAIMCNCKESHVLHVLRKEKKRTNGE